MDDTPDCVPGHGAQPSQTTGTSEPLWRMRKQDRTIDAALLHHPEGLGGGVEIQFRYGGEFMYGRRWPTRELAVAEADEKRQELARAGWMLHW